MSRVLMPGQAPAAGFDAPMEMLDACHRRIERMLTLLGRLAAHLDASGCDDQARQAAVDVMRYFDQAGPLHHEDEERHLLPRLRQAGETALADRMADDHARMKSAWAALRPALASVADGRLARLDEWRAFAALHWGHLMLEDRQAYPLVSRLIDTPSAQAMGIDMAARRGVRMPA